MLAVRADGKHQPVQVVCLHQIHWQVAYYCKIHDDAKKQPMIMVAAPDRGVITPRP